MLKKRSPRIQRNDAYQIGWRKMRGAGLHRYKTDRLVLVPFSHANGYYGVRSINFWNTNRNLLDPRSSKLKKG